jgi:uncharacterized protein (DUF305 family)
MVSTPNLSRRTATAALAAAALGALSASAASADDVEVAGVQTGILMARDPAPSPSTIQLEMDFLRGMIMHHRGGMEMANMALEKAMQGDLRQFARKVMDMQRMEVDKMSAYLREWYGQLDPQEHGMTPEMEDMLQSPLLHSDLPDMESRMLLLQSVEGKDFDVEFMNAMSLHHAEAIGMAAPVLIGAHHADLHRLAQNMVISQGQELKQLGEWLDKWYGVSRAY